MNGYERIDAVLNKKTPDRLPVMLHNFMPAARKAGYTMKEFRDDPKKMAHCFLSFAINYALDGILVDVDTTLLAGAMGAGVDYPIDEPARVIGPSDSNIDMIYELADPKKLYTDERIGIYLECISILRKEAGGEIYIRGNADQGPFSLAMLLYGMQDFLIDLMDEEKKESILKLIQKCLDIDIEFHKLVKQAGADCTSFGDSSCGPDLISRSHYLEYAMPFHVKLKHKLDEQDIKCICHICGNLDNIINDVASIGFAGIEADHKTNIQNAHDVLKDRCVMFGPIDPVGIFRFGNVIDVINMTEEIAVIFKDGGLVIGAGCALGPDTPDENIKAFVKTAQARYY